MSRQVGLGHYGEQFGAPEYEVRLEAGRIAEITIVRGAPCGATWEAAQKLIGTPVAEAVRLIGLHAQYFCFADPAGWDPIHGKSPVHFAGNIHSKALAKAINSALKQN